MTHSVDISQPLSPANPYFMNKVAKVARMEVMYGICNMKFHSWRLTWLWPLLSTQPANSRDQPWAPEWQHSLGWSIGQLLHGRLIKLDSFHYGRGSIFVLIGIDTYSGYRFAFSACSVSAKTTIHEFTDCFTTIIVIHMVLCLIKELTSPQMRCTNVPTSWNSLVYNGPHHLQAAGLIKLQNGFWRLIIAPARW